jgi:type I restriction enzyme S subunit
MKAAMKKAWQTKTLCEVCEIRPPKSEARKRLAADAPVSFLPMEDLGIDKKFVQAAQTKPLSAVQGSYTYFADGDVLLAKITPCFENGKLGIAEELTNGIGFGSSEYIVFRPDKTISKEWLYYYLSRETCQGRSKREPVWRSKSSPVEGYGTSGRMASGA